MRRSRSRVWAFTAAIVVVSLLSLLVPLERPAQAQLFGMTDQQEIQLGRQIEAQIQKQYGFDTDPQWNERVASIGIRLAKVSERPNLPWTYHVTRDASVNAFAVPGGFIFVTRGLMRFIKSDNELAFVLGHETTHVAHRHAVELAQRDMELQFGAILITQILFGGNMTAYQLTQITRGLVDASYSRDKEYEADHYGVIFSQKAGFDPTASITFFERLAALEQQQHSAVGGAFASHPPTADRIKAVRTELIQMGYQVAGAGDAPPPPAPSPQAPPPTPAQVPPASPSTSGVIVHQNR